MLRSLIACAFVLCLMPAQAQLAYDCKLESNPLLSDLLNKTKPAPEVAQSLAVSAKLRNGEAVTYKKDDAVIVADVRVVRAAPAIVPNVPIRLKNSWPLSPGFTFAEGQPLRYFQEVQLADGRTFAVLRLTDDSVLFIDSEGRFCDKVLNGKARPVTWTAGSLSHVSDPFVLDRKVIETESPAIGLRIIFNGVASGQISFQEVWVKGEAVVKTIARGFDQFARSVTIAGITLELVDVSAAQATLRYQIAERSAVDNASLAKLGPGKW